MEFDPEAYLEAKLQSEAGGAAAAIPPPPPPPPAGEERPRERERERSRDRDKRRSRSRDRDGDRDRDKDRDRDRDRRRDSDRDRDRRDRGPPRPRYDENYKPEPTEGGYGGGHPVVGNRHPRHGRDPVPKDDEAGFERDLRTVFIAQVARKADERDLFAFFTECGKVTDVRIIKDTQTRRSKGIAYVEFESMDMCPAAVAKSGQIICGFPCIVQASQAEKNIAAKQEKLAAAQAEQPARVQVSNLHKDIGQDDLQALFSPFGQVVSASIQRDHGPANSGMVTFKALAEAQKAVAHLNGFDLAGMQLVAVLQAPPPPPMMPMGGLTGVLSAGTELLDDHETGGVQVTAQSRAALMQKLARGQDYAGAPSMPAPAPPMHGYPMNAAPPPPPPPMAPVTNMANLPPTQPQPSEYMLLVNMFDPSKETEPNWHIEIQDDVSEECSKFGTVQKCIIDRANPSGLVYLKFNNPDSSFKAAAALNGRFFAGKAIVALYLSPHVFQKFCPVGP